MMVVVVLVVAMDSVLMELRNFAGLLQRRIKYFFSITISGRVCEKGVSKSGLFLNLVVSDL